jgi:hypothetical protein
MFTLNDCISDVYSDEAGKSRFESLLLSRRRGSQTLADPRFSRAIRAHRLLYLRLPSKESVNVATIHGYTCYLDMNGQGAAPVLWQEAKTPEGRVYYYHTVTKATQWTKPEELMTAAEVDKHLQLWIGYADLLCSVL